MSHETDKIRNSKRRYKDEVAIERQRKIAKQHNVGDYQNKTEREPHRLHKRHAMDCGNPGCYLCGNPRHIHKDKLTAQEKRIFQDIDTPNDRHSNGLKNEEDIL